MKTDTTEKGLESHITQHLCLVNTFEERLFSHYNSFDFAKQDSIFSVEEKNKIISYLKIEFTLIVNNKQKMELNRECKMAMNALAMIEKRNIIFTH
ncbi:MAG: hypothetical protein LCH37_03190 [Bacteroidetes bacterium]|nr:hypothetical protein [Bacteroidota bacterium]